jgi:hypothetical protein
VILPDSVLAVTDSFCDYPSLTLVGFGQVSHLKNLSGFSRTALADVLVPASVEIVAGFASDDDRPHSLRISFERESRLYAACLARRFGFVGYPPKFLKAKREPLSCRHPHRAADAQDPDFRMTTVADITVADITGAESATTADSRIMPWSEFLPTNQGISQNEDAQ